MVETRTFGPVLRIATGRLRGWTSFAYWVDGLLIDAGCPAGARRFVAALQGRPVAQLVLTHHHEDHVGAAARLGVTPRIHPLGLALLAGPYRLPYYERVVWGTPAPAAGAPLGATVATDRHRFQVHHTPGHAPDHVILHEPDQGWLFSGDLLIHPRVPVLRRGEDLGAILASLRLALTLPAERIFCGHYRGTEPGHLQEKLDFLLGVVGEAARLGARGWAATAIRDRLLGPEGHLAWISGGRFSKLNLIRGALALAGGAGFPPPSTSGPGTTGDGEI